MRTTRTSLPFDMAKTAMTDVKPQLMHDSAQHINDLVRWCHTSAVAGHWWHERGSPPAKLDRNFGELLALVHSEISEAMEGGRKDKMDEHLPMFTSVEVELADALIRIFDLAGACAPNLGKAFCEKWLYNQSRSDHKIENRTAPGGKQF